MRINTNVSAINAGNNLSRVQDQVSESMSKLSSGLRINRSGDDAAGLGIANKLHADTRALSQASRNAEQANSLLQIADGATSTIQKMLERIKELATQSASDNTDGDASTGGRKAIQAEFASLTAEITRTVQTTKFQGKTLIDGNFGATVSGTALTTSVGAYSASSSGAAAGTYTLTAASGNVTLDNGAGVTQTLTLTAGAKQTLNFDKLGISINTDTSVTATSLDTTTITVTAGSSGGSFMIGSSGQYSGADNISLSKLDLTLATLGINSDDLTSVANAKTALSHVDSALAVVASVQGDIGAAQNRIGYAQDNLKTSIQNYSAAESVIRDVDMAQEMTNYTKNNILAQAGTAMLAQANQAGQGVLTLLRG
jgi:flagellin